MPKVYVQKWIEYEDNWGERPDGYSLHLRLEDIPKFVAQVDQVEVDYLAKARQTNPEAKLDVCDYPSGQSFEKEVDDETYKKILTSEFGIKIFGKWSELEL